MSLSELLEAQYAPLMSQSCSNCRHEGVWRKSPTFTSTPSNSGSRGHLLLSTLPKYYSSTLLNPATTPKHNSYLLCTSILFSVLRDVLLVNPVCILFDSSKDFLDSRHTVSKRRRINAGPHNCPPHPRRPAYWIWLPIDHIPRTSPKSTTKCRRSINDPAFLVEIRLQVPQHRTIHRRHRLDRHHRSSIWRSRILHERNLPVPSHARRMQPRNVGLAGNLHRAHGVCLRSHQHHSLDGIRRIQQDGVTPRARLSAGPSHHFALPVRGVVGYVYTSYFFTQGLRHHRNKVLDRRELYVCVYFDPGIYSWHHALDHCVDQDVLRLAV